MALQNQKTLSVNAIFKATMQHNGEKGFKNYLHPFKFEF
jgi:hypothetical protein